MAVYVDSIERCIASARWPYPTRCHLFGDDVDELLRFGSRLGLSPMHLHARGDFPHFDLTAGRRRKAVDLGAREVSRQFAMEFARRHRVQRRAGRPGPEQGLMPKELRGPWQRVPVVPLYAGQPVRIVEMLRADRVTVETIAAAPDGQRQRYTVTVAELGWQALWEMPARAGERRCRVCGCSDDRPCAMGCYWVEEDLCSRCTGQSCHA